MTLSARDVSVFGGRRMPVVGDRVACWRIGSVDLERCRECLYLLRLEQTGSDRARQEFVVCSDAALEADDFAW
jgi:hypothetical protein